MRAAARLSSETRRSSTSIRHLSEADSSVIAHHSPGHEVSNRQTFAKNGKMLAHASEMKP